MCNWKDKSVLIIGASSGIGEATARYLDSLGAKTFLVARDANKLKEICGELSAESDWTPVWRGKTVHAFFPDVPDPEHCGRSP